MYKSIVYHPTVYPMVCSIIHHGISKPDKYVEIMRTTPKSCTTCVYHDKGICNFLSLKLETKTMIINKDLCGPYHKFHKKE